MFSFVYFVTYYMYNTLSTINFLLYCSKHLKDDVFILCVLFLFFFIYLFLCFVLYIFFLLFWVYILPWPILYTSLLFYMGEYSENETSAYNKKKKNCFLNGNYISVFMLSIFFYFYNRQINERSRCAYEIT